MVAAAKDQFVDGDILCINDELPILIGGGQQLSHLIVHLLHLLRSELLHAEYLARNYVNHFNRIDQTYLLQRAA